MMTSSEIRRHTNSVEDEAVDEDDVDIDVTGDGDSSGEDAISRLSSSDGCIGNDDEGDTCDVRLSPPTPPFLSPTSTDIDLDSDVFNSCKKQRRNRTTFSSEQLRELEARLKAVGATREAAGKHSTKFANSREPGAMAIAAN
ncbi:hypothetical protein NP493_430g04015 [Ridgeia piscesae]|uniref:Homeobox domain-containing protein n=1 Tax=Ridgeia piscesae TaxID=27915 RepID=A0AAD9L1K5_RIDPI|nr:hypothetical protein NP493_430g04015 [Ridgeia piscesae]